ncbi:rho GTPase-activating protein REN1 [Rhodamnia argentea]|uniref:Rho GTPase-activating protein REN1 n=1 Tax=Rhodamnia argentea TaxID=178133 RepID=A0A8B8P121_9MYRT|nr:rho GTPase-activating protein REN1 [Rhodamnia argentea]XP_048130077.1 rho GTPase-activating protein REN1 [Rhodamnia argentea]
MTTRNSEPSQGESGVPPPAPAPAPAPAAAPPPAPASVSTPAPGPPLNQSTSRTGNKVFKSGPLFLSSKGIGWTSWKKRWFILTRTSLVFFRSDPSAIPQKGSEVNLTLGGIDLNNSGSVVVKADKKLLTVLFPDGRDGRAFTLKAETLEDLYEWKTALENALAEAPNAALVMGQNGIFRSDQAGAPDGSLEQLKDRQNIKSMVVGRPVLLALEEVDGTPSFLEKALRFIEEHGIKIEGILRQAADVDDVEHRIRDYEQGSTEFSAEEDAHVIADCIKYVLRELPSSPVPASCCNALLEACRTDRDVRVNAMRTAICETFPEPNRRLLQRILMMMQTVASHMAENRMSSSAVAACMAPLLLRPLLAGDCELEHDFDVGGDGSAQLLQAAAAANHAQAIVITLLEEYGKIFGEHALSPDIYSDSEESGSESEEETDDDGSYEDDEHDDLTQDSELESEDDRGHTSSESHSSSDEDGDYASSNKTDGDNAQHDKVSESCSPHSDSPEAVADFNEKEKLSQNSPKTLPSQNEEPLGSEHTDNQLNNHGPSRKDDEFSQAPVDDFSEIHFSGKSADHVPLSNMKKSTTIAGGTVRSVRRPAVWGRTPGKKNLSMEYINCDIIDEVEIQRLEVTKLDLQDRIAEEAKENAVLQADLEKQKNALHKRRQALEQDVARLQEQLQKERDLRKALEAGLKVTRLPVPVGAKINEKTKADLEDLARTEADITNLKQKADDLGVELNKEREKNYHSMQDLGDQQYKSGDDGVKLRNTQGDIKNPESSYLAGRSTSTKDSSLDGIHTENEMEELTSSSNIHQPLSQQPDSAYNSRSRSLGQPAYSQAADSAAGRPLAPVSSKRSGTRNEGPNSTTSALSKLTTRLNFLKERRTQIANELQNMDKGRGSSPAFEVLEKGRASESQSEEIPGIESDGSSRPIQDPRDWLGRENNSLNREKYKNITSQDADGGTRLEGQPSQNASRNSESDVASRTGPR